MAKVLRVPSATPSRRSIRVLSILVLVTTYCLIALGSTVRVTNSGMGCRGWPLCSGQAGPLSTFHPLMEQSHRYLTTIVSLLIVALAVAVWRAGAPARHVLAPVVASVGVIVVQIVLGAVTVVTNNAPVTVALHLLVATLFLAVVTVTAVAAFVPPERSWSLIHGPGWLAWSSVAALYAVFVSGSIVVNGGAASACTSWPVCFSSSASTGLVVLQLVHRSLVLVGSVLVVTYLVSLLRRRGAEADERRLALGALGLLVTQVAAGALSAANGGRAGVADVHLAVGSALWVVVVALFALSARSRPCASVGPAPIVAVESGSAVTPR